MAKNFRTPCDDVKDLLNNKGIKEVPCEKWVIGNTYFTLGLDEWCYPCVTHTKYLGVVAEGKNKGMFHFYGDSVHYVVNEIDLYDNTFTNLMAMQSACKSVINNG